MGIKSRSIAASDQSTNVRLTLTLTLAVAMVVSVLASPSAAQTPAREASVPPPAATGFEPPPAAPGLEARFVPEKPLDSVIGEGQSTNHVHVKFHEGTSVRLRSEALITLGRESLSGLDAVLAKYPDATIGRLFTRPEAELAGDKVRIEAKSRRQQADLNLYYRISVPTDATSLINELNALDIVEIAYAEPLPQSPPTPNFEGQQGYLNAAPGGIDAKFSWVQPGGPGRNVTIIDVEHDWNLTHEDLSELAEPGAYITNGTPCNYWGASSTNHGTAVAGELVADRNGIGVTGSVYEADFRVVNQLALDPNPNCTDKGPNAINAAHEGLGAGDVILLELQVAGPDPTCDNTGLPNGLIAGEWIAAYYDAIVSATSDGIIVVEAAGNGGCNLDDTNFHVQPFPLGKADSGAIIVGAGSAMGGTAPAHGRLVSSTYGSRVDLQGWGETVVTSGYGDLHPPSVSTDVRNDDYTEAFNGTSSASPMVAGAAAALSSIAQQQGTVLTPQQIRAVLDATGTPQAFGLAGNIGPLPDIEAALKKLGPDAKDESYVVVSGGAVAGLASARPDIEPNNTVATAQSLDGFFSLGHNPNVGNETDNTSTTVPHATVLGTGDGTLDFFSFTVAAAGDTVVLDIDDGFGGAGSFDTMIQLYDPAGVAGTTEDESNFQHGAGGSANSIVGPLPITRDSYLEFTAPAAGTYAVAVGSFPGVSPVPAGADYRLQVSVPNGAMAPVPGVLENDVNVGVPEETLTAAVLTPPGNGTLTLGPDGGFSYAHNGSATISDSFVYQAQDSYGNTHNATASITILHPPVLNPIGTQTVAEGATLDVTITASDLNASDPLSFSLSGAPPFATLTDNGDGTATLSLKPGSDDAGTYPGVTVTVSDATDSDTETFDVTVTDVTAPTVTITTPANGASYTQGATVNAAYACTDEAGGSGIKTSAGTVANGAAIDTATLGDKTFTVTGTDNAGNTTVVTHNYTATNTAPVANAQAVTTAEDSTKAITLSGSDTDGDPLSFTVVTAPTHGTLSGTAPNLSYTPTSNYSGPDSFTFKANDTKVDSAAATVSITVTTVDDVGISESASSTLGAGGTLSTDGGDGATAADPVETSVTSPQGGAVTITEGPASGPTPSGFVLLGVQALITAPPATATSPLTLMFTIDSSVIPIGQSASTITVFKDGTAVAACTGSGTATPDPCVSAHTDVGVDAKITVLTSSGSLWSFGIPIVADTVGVVNTANAQWYLANSAGTVTNFEYGNPVDEPISGNWDGPANTTSTPGLFRQSDGFLYARNANSTGIADFECFAGDPSDVPLSGDWDGDGDDNLGIMRLVNNQPTFYLYTTTCANAPMGAAQISFEFGDAGDTAVSGDWDGDGKDEIGLYRRSNGFFYNRNTLDTGVAHNACFAGDPSDYPIGGDWDGDADGNLGIYRPSVQKFFLFTTSCVGLAPPATPFANAMGAAQIEVSLPVAGADVTMLRPVAGTFGLG